jgi:hypothetical protein
MDYENLEERIETLENNNKVEYWIFFVWLVILTAIIIF